MRLTLKILGGLVLLIVLAIAAGLIYAYAALPKKEAPQQIAVQATAERLQRGEYLVERVVVCFHCHSQRKMEVFATPRVRGTEGRGDLFIKDESLGELYSPNITPHALKDWTDGELIRAVTAGVNKDGDPLFPIMPYKVYANLKEEDLHAVIAYVRSLKPIEYEVTPTRLKFPLNLIVRMIPGPPERDTKAQSTPGNYLAKVAGCIDCHTPINEKGEPLPGMTLAGGQDFIIVKSANITPDLETGIGKWTKEDFISAFKKWQDPAMQQIVMPKDQNTVMPWISYSGMKEEDLAAIYEFLRTAPPIRNPVQKFKRPG
jgi:mono/diheme cytochrome c family protein